jgi:hypothetical protein
MKKIKSKVTSKETTLDGEKVKIIKLTMKRLKAIQREIRELKEEDEDYQMKSIHITLRNSVVDAEDMTDEDFEEFNPGDLAKLASEVMTYAGVDVESVEDKELGNSQVKKD